jgi:hypothetical protein
MISYLVSKRKEDMLVVERLKIPMMAKQTPSVMPETDDHIIIDSMNPILS